MSSENRKYDKVAVLLGGDSSEREVSLKTGAAVAAALVRTGRQVTTIDATTDTARRLAEAAPQAVFICLHGRRGEDGTVQGLLELMRIPYTGSGVMASAVAMDKTVAKILMEEAGVPTPPGRTFEAMPSDAVMNGLELPVVIKPSREGSTVGISIVHEPGELSNAFRAAFDHDDEVLVEEYIKGRELTVSVIGSPPRTLPVVEVIPEKGFYDYYAKYVTGDTQYICPAELTAEEEKLIDEYSLAAYRAVRCRGLARVDILLREGRPYVLEINTIPGMTESSLAPKAAAAAGTGFDELVDEIMESASLDAE